MKKAEGEVNTHRYHFEKKNSIMIIQTNSNKRVNALILIIDCLNLLWGVVGIILIQTVKHVSQNAVTDCMKNYGLNTVLFVEVFVLISLMQVFRVGIYIICVVYHQKILGWLERHWRRIDI